MAYLFHAGELLPARGGYLHRGFGRLTRGGGDRGGGVTRLHRLFPRRFYRLLALLRRFHGAIARLLDLVQDRAHLDNGLLGLFGQAFHLLCDNGEALARVAGLCGLDGRVHRQQVRLLGQVADRGDDVAHRPGLLTQAADGLTHHAHLDLHLLDAADGPIDRSAPRLGELRKCLGLVRDAGGLLVGELRRLLDFLDRGGRLVGGGGRLTGARRHLSGDRKQFGGGTAEAGSEGTEPSGYAAGYENGHDHGDGDADTSHRDQHHGEDVGHPIALIMLRVCAGLNLSEIGGCRGVDLLG